MALPVGSASAKVTAPQTIWSKAEISYEQYRADALECAMQGLSTNIDRSAPVEALRAASRQLDAIDASAQAALSLDAGQMGRPPGQSIYVHNGLEMATNRARAEQSVKEAYRPEEQYAVIKELMFKVVRNCMVRQGYTKMTLTEDQRDEYSALKGGDDARRHYLHSLASDPKMLETQREVVAETK